jgi:hypothetical protein
MTISEPKGYYDAFFALQQEVYTLYERVYALGEQTSILEPNAVSHIFNKSLICTSLILS